MARRMAATPAIGVHHMEGHLLAPLLEQELRAAGGALQADRDPGHAVLVEENFFIEVNIRTPQIIFTKNLEGLLLTHLSFLSDKLWALRE